MTGKVLAVVGGQYGSEGKGVVVNKIAHRYDVHVRTGGPNAGHSFYHEGRLWKMQQLPCGWTNPEATLVIGAGAVVDLEQLNKEVIAVEQAGYYIRHRLFIDAGAMVLDRKHHVEEGGVDGELHKRIGSTGEGVGAARIDRIRRDAIRTSLAVRTPINHPLSNNIVTNTPAMLSHARGTGGNILLEGTQGAGLSLIHGPWPYVTSHDTNAAQLAADAGIPPHHVTDVLMVVRTYPIRVAGNSGPLKGELTWEEMSRRLGRPVIEQTTVTKETRRIGSCDEQLVRKAVTLNGPTAFALMFADYLNPNDAGVTTYDLLSVDTHGFVAYLENAFGVPVAMVGTGGEGWQVIERRIV